MTAYWDALKREVREASQFSNDDFVETVIDIETRVIREVSLATGDREFPDDLREKVQGVIAINAIDFGRYIYERPCSEGNALANARARAWLLTMRYSILLEELHSVFHVVATRRAPNRYDTFFTDDPTSFLRAREAMLG
jgi:hypothetical protein